MPKISSMLPCLVFLTSCGVSLHSNDLASESIREVGPLEGESRLEAEVYLEVGSVVSQRLGL